MEKVDFVAFKRFGVLERVSEKHLIERVYRSGVEARRDRGRFFV